MFRENTHKTLWVIKFKILFAAYALYLVIWGAGWVAGINEWYHKYDGHLHDLSCVETYYYNYKGEYKDYRLLTQEDYEANRHVYGSMNDYVAEKFETVVKEGFIMSGGKKIYCEYSCCDVLNHGSIEAANEFWGTQHFDNTLLEASVRFLILLALGIPVLIFLVPKANFSSPDPVSTAKGASKNSIFPLPTSPASRSTTIPLPLRAERSS